MKLGMASGKRTEAARVIGWWVLVAAMLPCCAKGGEHTFVTWDTLEPDKVIAAWLIKTHVDTNAVFQFVSTGTPIEKGVPFDIPGSSYARDHRHSASEQVLRIHAIRDPKAAALGRLARKLELGRWHAVFTDPEKPLADALLNGSALHGPATPQRLSALFAQISAWRPPAYP